MKIGRLKIDFKKKYPDLKFPKIDIRYMRYKESPEKRDCKICGVIYNSGVNCFNIGCGECFSYKATQEDVNLYIKQIYEDK